LTESIFCCGVFSLIIVLIGSIEQRISLAHIVSRHRLEFINRFLALRYANSDRHNGALSSVTVHSFVRLTWQAVA
ncbi:hypothetical protein T10_12656, partial [Trichinella papuae]